MTCIFCDDETEDAYYVKKNEDDTFYPICEACKVKAGIVGIAVGRKVSAIIDLDIYDDWVDLGIYNACYPEDFLQKVINSHVEMKRLADVKIGELREANA